MRYRIPENILMQEVADEMVLLDPVSGVYFTLDAVGTRMVVLFRELEDGPGTAERIAKEYAVNPEQALDDLNTLLLKMTQHGLAESLDSDAE
jgi:hypothetical protein